MSNSTNKGDSSESKVPESQSASNIANIKVTFSDHSHLTRRHPTTRPIFLGRQRSNVYELIKGKMAFDDTHFINNFLDPKHIREKDL